MLVDNLLVSPVIVKYLIETVDQILVRKIRSIEIMKKWQGTNNLKMLHHLQQMDLFSKNI
jgi:hypothetical protein